MCKFKKRFLALLVTFTVAFTSLFSTAGCISVVQLDAPTGLKYSNNKLTWNYVDSASGYIVNVDGVEYSTSNNYYDLSNLDLIDGNEYIAKVKAKGDGYVKTNSDYSLDYVFIYEKKDEQPLDPDKKEDLTEAEKNDILNDANSKYMAIGRTVNALTDNYCDTSYLGKTKIFDFNKLKQLDWFKISEGKMTSRIVTKTSAEDYFKDFNTKISNKIGAEVQYDVFSASVDRSFAMTFTNSDVKATNEIYCTFEQIYADELVGIDSFASTSQYQNILSEEFLNDASKVNTVDEAKSFLSKYGTHFIGAAYFGGKISFDYYIANSESKWSQETGVQMTTTVQAGIDGLGQVGTSSGFSMLSSLGLNKSKSFEKFSAQSTGGNSIPASSLEQFMQGYSGFVADLNDQSKAKKSLVDYADKGLVEIWEVLPQEYNQTKILIEQTFLEEAKSANSRVLSKYYKENVETKPIITPLDAKCCLNDTGYDPNKPETDEVWYTSNENFDMGQLILYGCTINSDGKYILQNEDEFAIQYNILTNPESLPLSSILAQHNTHSFYLSDDTSTKIVNCNDFNERIGLGASYVQIRYKNSAEPTTISLTNIFKNQSQDSKVKIAWNKLLDEDKEIYALDSGEIESIKVVVVYELFFEWGWWAWEKGWGYPNFREEYIYNFA